MSEEYYKEYNGSKYYYLDGYNHRIGGPAVEAANGDKFYYVNGKLTKIEKVNGYMALYLNDKLHNTNGPAVIWPNGDREWWVNGLKFSEKKFNILNTIIKEMAIENNFDNMKILNYLNLKSKE